MVASSRKPVDLPFRTRNRPAGSSVSQTAGLSKFGRAGGNRSDASNTHGPADRKTSSTVSKSLKMIRASWYFSGLSFTDVEIAFRRHPAAPPAAPAETTDAGSDV